MGLLPFPVTKTKGFICGACITLLTTTAGHAATVYKLDLTYSKVVNDHDFTLPEVESKDWGAAVRFEAGIRSDNKLFYLEPTFLFNSCYSKVCTGGLEIEDGMNALSWLSIMHRHRSYHSFDTLNGSGSTTRYELFDSVGIRVRFVQ